MTVQQYDFKFISNQFEHGIERIELYHYNNNIMFVHLQFIIIHSTNILRVSYTFTKYLSSNSV